jgi:uncharacterized Ntn-hydrolase superfamily protein
MTYSIVARDPGANQMGIAVQSHHLSVGAHVIAVEAGVGVMAVQSYANRDYAVDGLATLRSVGDAGATMRSLLETHSRTERRAQVAVLGVSGPPEVHTGHLCISHCGHVTNQDAAAQANMVQSRHLPEKMLQRFEASAGDLVSRLLDSLDAAEEEGGDWRGRQSAALTVVPITASGDSHPIDLRVDDHPDPLGELRRLDRIRRAAIEMDRAFGLAADGDLDAAVAILDATQEVYETNLEPTAWSAVLLARAGRLDHARSRLDRVIGVEPGWEGLVRALPAAALLPDDPSLIEALLKKATVDDG